MPFNGSGTFNRTNGVQTGATLWQDNAAAANKVITGLKHDTNDQDIADGLTLCVTRDGQSPAQADLPMGGFNHTGVDPLSGLTLSTEYASGAVAQATRPADAGATGGTSTAYTASLTPAIAAYADKQFFRVQFNAACGNNPTIAFNGIAPARKLYKNVAGTATQLVSNDIPANFIGLLRYDDTLDGAVGGFWVANLGYISPTTTRGDMIYRGASADTRLAIGAVDTVLVSDGTDPLWRTQTAQIDAAFGSTQGNVLYRNATVWTVLAPGTAGQALITGGAAADPSWSSIPTGSITQASAIEQNPIAASATVGPTAHGLGVIPKCWVELVCLTGELGYAAGEVVELGSAGSDPGTNLAAFSIQKTATNITITTSSAVNLNIVNASTMAVANITPANWKLRITPYRVN